jgi:3-oxoadipate enol-lactonase
MAFLQIGEYRMHYELSGAPGADVLVLSNSLGTNLAMWDPQLAEFQKHFRVLRYDTRGHGQSAVTPGEYSFAQLGGDVVGLLDALRIESAYFCGLSMGGMTGLWLGLHATKRFRKLVISSASAKFGNSESWEKRIAAVRQGGMATVATQVVERWFTTEFRERDPKAVKATREMIEGTSPEGYVSCCAALRDSDLREEVAKIATPTLIISGSQDSAAPPSDGQFLARQIRGAQYCEVHASHLLNVELSVEFTDAVLRFLNAEGA